MQDHSVIIVGAGPAGLGAAHELTTRGLRPLVLEQAGQVGGIARTEVYKGYRFDLGGHRFYTKCDEVRQLWHRMLADDFIEVPRLSRIFYRGRFIKYPLELLDTIRCLGVAESILVVLSYLKTQVVPPREEQTFEQWVTRRFGARLFRTFFKTYTEKIWGIPCNVLRADWAAQRIRGLSLTRAVRDAIFGSADAKSLIKEFHYPVLGPGMMWQRFERAVTDAGGCVRMNAEAVSISHEDGRVRSVAVRQADGETEMPVEHVISSMSVTELVRRLSPAAPDDVLRAADGLTYRAFIMVALIVDRADLFRDNWIYVHDPAVRVGRIQNFKNWSAAMVADPGKTCASAWNTSAPRATTSGRWASGTFSIWPPGSWRRSGWPSGPTSTTAPSCGSRRRILFTTRATPRACAFSGITCRRSATFRPSAGTACTGIIIRTTRC